MLERLRPLYRTAVSRRPAAFVNLDMEEYRDLDLTIDVFTRLLSEPEFHQLKAGIVLQAYLPTRWEPSTGSSSSLASVRRRGRVQDPRG